MQRIDSTYGDGKNVIMNILAFTRPNGETAYFVHVVVLFRIVRVEFSQCI
jgi:hypothetical protein